ncbi:MAG: hypothetical protein K8S94_01900 [Planctomycetia bacterium]|nr:hypothetical protein [Planctomycetia bacterium]
MAESHPLPSAPRPRPRGLVWPLVRWLLTGAVIAVIAALLWLPTLVGTPERVSRLVAQAVPELRADVKLSRIGVGWLGPIVLDGLEVVPRNGDKAPITIRRIEISNGLAGVLFSLGDLGRLRVEGLEVDIEFDREHRSNIDAILPPDAAAAPADGQPAAPKPAGGPRRSLVRVRLEVEDAVVRISGPWTKDAWVSDPIDLRATLANAADGSGEWTVEPVQLLAQAELQQTVAHEVLAYIVPVLADSARTSGRFSLRLDGARLPVGRPEAAEISGLLSMHEVNLGPGPLVENMFKSMPLKLPAPPTVRIADESNIEFHLVDQRMWHKGLKFGIPLTQSGQRLDVRSEGSVGLEDRSLDVKLTLPIPADLPQDRPLVAALAGKQISLGVGGELGDPKVIFDGSIKAAAGEVLVDLIDRLRKGPRPQSPAPAPVPAPAPAAGPQPAAPPQPGWSPPGSLPKTVPDSAAAEATDQKPADAEQEKPLSPREMAEQVATEAANRAGAEPGTTDAIVDIVGSVLEEVAKRRAERRAAEEANPGQTPPPRRGRLLQRRPPPQSPPPPAPKAPAPPAEGK